MSDFAFAQPPADMLGAGLMPPMPLGGPGGMDMGMAPPPPPPMPPPAAGPDPDDPYMGKDPDDLLIMLRAWYDDDVDHWDPWRRRAEEDFNFAALDQWTDDEKKLLEDELRVPIVFDRIGPIIESVLGQQVANRQEARYIPREQGDAQVNEFLTGAGEWFRDLSSADSEETAAFKEVIICGLGCVETTLDYETNPDGQPKVEQIDVLEMLADCSARKTNLRDARRIWRVKNVPREDAESMFPDADPEDLDAVWADRTKGVEVRTTAEGSRRYYEGQDVSTEDVPRNSYVTLVECQWWEYQVFYRMVDPLTGEATEMKEDQYFAFMERAPQLAPLLVQLGYPPIQRGVRQRRKVYYKAFIGKKVLQVTPTLDPKGFTYKFITGYKDRNKGTWIGLVTKMKDPQRWANKWLSQTLHILNSQAGAGMMMEEEQRLEPDKWEEQWTRPNSVLKLKQGALTNGKFTKKPSAEFPQGYSLLMEFAASAVREASGVNLEQLGMREAVQPGVLEYQRRQSGVQVLAGLFDALRLYRIDQARLILVIIQDHLSDGRLVRIAGPQAEQLVPLTRDKTLGEFDVIVDEAPTSPNQKEATWQVIQALLPFFGEAIMASPQIMLEVLKASPLPSAFIEAVSAAMQPPEPTPEEAEMKELELENMRQMVRGVGAEATKDEAAAEQQLAQAQLAMARAQEVGTGSAVNVDQAQAQHYRALAAYHESRARQATVETVQAARQPPPMPQTPQRPPMHRMPDGRMMMGATHSAARRPQAPRPQRPQLPPQPQAGAMMARMLQQRMGR